MAGYDPKKAALYNKLKQQGLSDDEAWKQGGFTDADENNYVINDSPYNNDGTKNTTRGQMGAFVVGSGTVQPTLTADEKAYRASVDAAGAGFDERLAADSANFDSTKNVERVAYPVKANSRPSTATPITYTTTSTEQVSGGGSKTITSGISIPNADSKSYDPQIAAKQAEITQFMKDNPSDRQRAKEGLPPLSPEESAARNRKLTQLGNEKSDLTSQQSIAETRANSTETDVPNTTTNTTTTTYSQTATNTPVQGPNNADPALADQEAPSLANTQVDAARAQAAQDPYNNGATSTEFVQNDAPAAASDPFSVTPRSLEPGVENSSAANVSANQDSGLLTPAESIEQAQVSAPEAVDAATFNANTNTDVLGAIGAAPAPVDTATDPGVKSPFGGAASNAAAAQNPEAAAAALQQEQANQEAATLQRAKEQQAIQAQFQAPADGDWRVRLKLAPSATYLYMDTANKILAPLKASNGVVFPYMPSIQTSYNADYSESALTHSNYKGYFYNSSYVGDVQITGTFTAQDTREANYLLAVIHFFRSVTKMFYGQDAQRGAPPPLVYIQGLGEYQFNNQPCVVRSFNYSLPNDVDYIRTKPNNYNINLNNRLVKSQNSPANGIASVMNRLENAFLPKGALPNTGAQELTIEQSVTNVANDTYVPTRIEITISLAPIQTRSQQSQQFSVKEFSNGNLLKGGFW